MWALFGLGLLEAHAGTACGNPRDAADSLFRGAEPCVAVDDAAERIREAALLRAVLDAGALRVPVAGLPDAPDAPSPVRPLPEAAPWLALERGPDGAWRYSAGTLAGVPELHRASFTWASRWFQSRLPAVPERRFLGVYPWQVAYAAALVALGALSARVARAVVAGRLRALSRRSGLGPAAPWLTLFDLPLALWIVAGLARFGITDLALPPTWAAPGRVVTYGVAGFATLLAASRALRVVGQIARARAAASPSRFDDQALPVAEQAGQVVIWVVGTLALLQAGGVEVWGFLAGLGIGSLAVALAAQDSIANLFGALNIFLDRPFQVGDWIVVGKLEGTVEEVGFRSCRVRTFHNSLLTIPNSRITSSEVDNLGVRERRRVKLTLGVTYDTPPAALERFVTALRTLLDADPAVDPSPQVHFHDFGPSALEILVYFHLRVPTWSAELEARARLLLAMLRLAEELEVRFAFPTVQVEGLPPAWYPARAAG